MDWQLACRVSELDWQLYKSTVSYQLYFDSIAMADNTCYGDFRSAQIESFELRNGKLYLYGDGFADGRLILHLFHIISIQKIPAGTELALDDGAIQV